MLALYFLWFLAVDVPSQSIALADLEVYNNWLQVLPADDGSVCLYDAREGRLVFLDANLKLIAKAGSKGQGPKELSFIRGGYWNPETRLFSLFDVSNKRISTWRGNGEHAGNLPLTGFMSDPRYVVGGRYAQLQPRMNGQNHYAIDVVTGEICKTIYNLDLSHSHKLTAVPRKKGRPATFSLAWDVNLHYAVGSNFIATLGGDAKTLVLLDFEGNKLGKGIPFGLPVRPTTKEQGEEVISIVSKRTRGLVRQHLVQPDHWPMVQGLEIDSQDRIWAFGQGLQTTSALPFKVFDQHGRLLQDGVIDRLPVTIRGQTAWFLYADDQEELHLEKRTLASLLK